MRYGTRCRPGDPSELAVGQERKKEDEEFLTPNDNDQRICPPPRSACERWKYRKCVPHHLAIHKLVANVAPHESSGRDESHAQQSIYRGTVSAQIGISPTPDEITSRPSCELCLPPIPEECNEAHQGDRGVRSLQRSQQHPSLPSAIRAWGIRPGFR